ncbi:Calmodulin-regulated spectrin-associated protein 2, partial [Xenoophorus captivus]
VRLKENMSLADRLYNLQLIQDFCKDNLNSCCHFSLEDMLYASSTIKVQPGSACICHHSKAKGF